MMYVDLIVLIVLVSLISIWSDRRFIRKRKEKTSNGT